MTPAHLEAVIADTGVDRFRWLTSDDNPDPQSREGYRRLVQAMAEALESGEPVARPTPVAASAAPNPHMALLQLVRDCPRAGPWSEGCGCTRRCARLGRDVGASECLECVKGDA